MLEDLDVVCKSSVRMPVMRVYKNFGGVVGEGPQAAPRSLG